MERLARTNYCGQLNTSHLDKQVVLMGWVQRRRDHGGLIFVDVRDREGIVQTVFNPERQPVAHEVAHRMRSEFVVAVRGTVHRRPPGTENPSLPSGAIEVAVEEAWILSEAKPPVFAIEDESDVSEEIRLA
ncbi:MAG TPA: OB-fold nucleic acid binding domain-containing protein, partial [Candidatus Methylomirabilis sp.]|nr:OB-fold nucleic acid binding domain-containing protein [Candidatus Methylomirabilis sp.]